MTTFDITGLDKPLALRKVRERAQAYIETMTLLGKPATRVVVSGADYSAIFTAVTKGRDKALPEISGLTLGSIPVERAP